MTWTLRLFDDNDVEIGWVTTVPYDYAITHPDGVDSWEEIRFKFSQSEFPVQGGQYERTPDGDLFMVSARDTLNISGDGEKHADWLEDECLKIDGVASAVVADE